VIDPGPEFYDAMVEACAFRRKLAEVMEHPGFPSDRLLENREQFVSLFEHLFWVTFAHEEGRPVRGSICICSPEEVPGSRVLAHEVPVERSSLVALLTASPNAPLGVHLGPGGPSIWGFLDAEPHFSPVLALRGPGTIAGMVSGRSVAVFREGRKFIVPPTRTLASLVEEGLSSLPSVERIVAGSDVSRLCREMMSHRHGGAIVIGPIAGDDWLGSICVDFAFDRATTTKIRDLRSEMTEIDRARPPGLADHPDPLYDHFRVVLRNIGLLTAIDGALVIREDLSLVGFGVKLRFPDEESVVSTFDFVTAEVVHGVRVADLGGMRHQSAARFVQHRNECCVLVASQDGRLTLFSWVVDPGHVVVVRGLEHFVRES